MKLKVPLSIVAMTVMLVLPTTVSSQQFTKARTYPPLGKLVDVGGHRLHITCTGKGGPTVVMEGGAGDFYFDWSLAQQKVAQFTRVCSYDSAGYAWSHAGPMPRTIQRLVADLDVGLRK